MKFEKQPRIVKRVDAGAESHGGKLLKSIRSGRRKATIDGNSKEDLPPESVASDALKAVITVSPMAKFQRSANGEGDEMISPDVTRSLNDFLDIHPEYREMAEILHR